MKKPQKKTAQTTTEAMKKKLNRTGLALSPIDAKKLLDSANTVTPTRGSPLEVTDFRRAIAEEAPLVGTVPPPGSLKGAAKSVLETLKGVDPNTLIDKLGERLAFERTGTRLYDQLLVKLDATGTFAGGPTRLELVEIREEERAHAKLVVEVLESLGADPTAMTPGADLVGVQGLGLVQSVADPRVPLGMALDSLLIAELTDNAGWELLVDLLRDAGHDAIADRFTPAWEAEERHLLSVRAWVVAHARLATNLAQEEAAE